MLLIGILDYLCLYFSCLNRTVGALSSIMYGSHRGGGKFLAIFFSHCFLKVFTSNCTLIHQADWYIILYTLYIILYRNISNL